MANNRLYIVDTETGDKCFLSKGLAFGWDGLDKDFQKRLDKWLYNKDIAASAGYAPTKLVLKTENEMPAGANNNEEELQRQANLRAETLVQDIERNGYRPGCCI